MSGQQAFIPNPCKLSADEGWVSVDCWLPFNGEALLQVLYQEGSGHGITLARCEKGRFLNKANRALVRGVRSWRFMPP